MTLSDRDIHWAIATASVPPPIENMDPVLPLVDPFIPEHLQPASIDLTLDNEFIIYHASNFGWWDENTPIKLDEIKDNPLPLHRLQRDRMIIESREFVLGSTTEWVNIPDNLVATIEGKSSLARIGLFVHITAGFVDPGFRGKITLEFFNASHRPVELVAGLKICQIAFHELSTPADRPYGSPGLGSKYQGQNRTTESRYRG